MNGQDDTRARLVAISAEAQRFYRQQLLTAPTAQGPCTYLKDRGLAHVLASDSAWQVGYAPAGWTALTDYLESRGFQDGEVVEAGLGCRSRRGNVVDRFRDRIMVPQRDPAGETVGFIGRAAPSAPADVPKYLNSPHTEIYDKGRLLFGLHENRSALAAGVRPVLVEGPFDVLAVAAARQSAPEPMVAVAPCGTALTSDQVALLAHHSPPGASAVVAYDNDDAGRRAAAAAYDRLGDSGHFRSGELLAVSLPRGTDPAEVLQVHGVRALQTALTAPERLAPLAQHVIEGELRSWEHVLDGAEGRIAAVKAVAPIIGKLPTCDVAQQVTRLAERVDLDSTTVTIALTDALVATKPAERGSHNSGTGLRGPLRGPLSQVPTGGQWQYIL